MNAASDARRTEGESALSAALAREPHACKLWAEFEQADDALAAAQVVRERCRIDASRVRVLDADTLRDPHFSDALEPATRRIGATLGWTHALFGVAGATLGCALLGLASMRGWVPGIELGQPWLLPLLGIFFGAIAGLLIAGAVSLKPHRGAVAAWLADAVRRQGHAFLIVHADDRDMRERVRRELGNRPARVLP